MYADIGNSCPFLMQYFNAIDTIFTVHKDNRNYFNALPCNYIYLAICLQQKHQQQQFTGIDKEKVLIACGMESVGNESI